MRVFGVGILTLLIWLPTLANVDIRTNIQDVYYRGNCEEAGSVTFSVNGDDFSGASPQTPVYVRLRLGSDARLCCTLVDILPPDGKSNRADPSGPLFLAMRLEGGTQSHVMNAPTDCVSIVRWIGGESDIWLRVQSASSAWLLLDGEPAPPSAACRVAWTLGVTARHSYDRSSWTYPFGCNLPANTKLPAAITNPANQAEGYAISTLLCVDLTQSTIDPMPALNSAVHIELSGFDSSTTGVTTEPDPNAIQTGNPLPIVMSGDDIVARGFDLYYLGLFPLHVPEVSIGLSSAPGTPTLASLANEFDIRIGSEYGFNAHSRIMLRTPTASSYGFLVQCDALGDPIPAFIEDGVVYYTLDDVDITNRDFLSVTPETELFNIGSDRLAGEACLVYQGDDLPGPYNTVHFDGSVYVPRASGPQDVILECSASISNYGNMFDSYPFNGTMDDGDPNGGPVTAWDQARFCEPSFVDIPPVSIVFGRFLLEVPTLSTAALVLFIALLALVAICVTRKKGKAFQ